MISLIIFIIVLLVTAGWLLRTRENAYKEVKVEERNYRGVGTGEFNTVKRFNINYILVPGIFFIIGLLVCMFQPYAVSRVDQGSVGIKVNLTGDDRGISDYSYETGWVPYNTWTEMLYEFPVYQRHLEYEDQIVITKGGFAATIRPTFNYKLKSDKVGDMFQELRLPIEQIEKGWLKTAIVGSVVDVANKWNVDDIFNKREEFEAAIVQECNKRVTKWFEVSQLRTNIVPPPALKASIEEKTRAIQETQAAEQKAKVADAQGKVKVANARADSAQAVITANGEARAKLIQAEAEAKAIKLKQQEVSPVYIDYIKAQKWDGKLPVTTLGNSTPMINLK